MNFPVSIKGVLFQRGSVVLLENGRAEWELPGGRLELGETPEACLAREIAEELACVVDIGPLLDCWTYEVLPGRVVLVVTYGVTRVDGGDLRHSDEHKALGLFPVDQIAGLALPAGYRRAIQLWAGHPTRGWRQKMTAAACIEHNAGESERLEQIILASPILGPILRQWAAVALPDCWLVAGAVAQTVWNDAFGLPPAHGIADIDLIYFDAADLSAGAEAHHAERIRRQFADLAVWIDVKNEARVHLWYASKFGFSIPPYTSATQAITTFPATATAVGVQPTATRTGIVAPFGLSDLLNLTVRPNKARITRPIYEAKVARWRAVWPGLTIIEWPDA